MTNFDPNHPIKTGEDPVPGGVEAGTGILRPPHPLRHYLSIYAMLWRNSLVREMTFKTNFILWIVVELCWFALQLTFINVIYLHTESIAGWSKWQVVLLIGAAHLIQEIFQALFLVNCTNLSELVRTGKLDFLLLLPVNTRFLVSLRQVDLGSFVNAAIAGAVMIYAGRELDLAPTFLQIAAFLALCIAGIVIHYSLMFLLATISFWAVRAQGIVWAYYNLFNVSRLPDSAFRGWFKVVFTFALPMLLVSNVPVRVLTDRMESPIQILILIGLAIVCLVLSELCWRYSVRHYTSASS
jgi:ABC-2 type transport system permease protein